MNMALVADMTLNLQHSLTIMKRLTNRYDILILFSSLVFHHISVVLSYKGKMPS